jgi:hypothetical protein
LLKYCGHFGPCEVFSVAERPRHSAPHFFWRSRAAVWPIVGSLAGVVAEGAVAEGAVAEGLAAGSFAEAG